MYYRLYNQLMCTYTLVLKCFKQFILLYKGKGKEIWFNGTSTQKGHIAPEVW
jgi:hypothetical protein